MGKLAGDSRSIQFESDHLSRTCRRQATANLIHDVRLPETDIGTNRLPQDRLQDVRLSIEQECDLVCEFRDDD